jgi:hypothetical protein
MEITYLSIIININRRFPTDFKYKGSAPTGELPKEINFALNKQNESKISIFWFLEIRSLIRKNNWIILKEQL